MPESDELPPFSENLNRLLGMHRLSQNVAARLLRVSEPTMSAWINGRSTPSLNTAIRIAEFFQLPVERLMAATFDDLLEHELANPERFRQVETAIGR